jgi:hypothetical protein
MVMDFPEAFETVQRALGMAHYHVTFRGDPDSGNYADCDAESEDCIAVVRFDDARCRQDNVIESAATHEALHLLLRDLVHAVERSPQSARAEEERVVRRLEGIVTAGIFGQNQIK